MTTPPTPARRTRRRLIIALALLALPVGLYFLLTSPLVIGAYVLSRLGSAIGGDATAQRVAWNANGTLTLIGPVVRAPGVPGEGGIAFRADRVDVHVSLPALWQGGPVITHVELDSPHIRVSQSRDDGSLNLAALTPERVSGGMTNLEQIPRVTVRGGVIEVGEHATDPARHAGATPFTSLKRINVEGDVERSPDGSGGSTITFRQVNAPGDPAANPTFKVEGRIVKDALTLSLSGLKLEDWPPEAVPTLLRENFRNLAMSGEISGTTLTYSLSGKVQVRVGLTDVALNLPISPQPQTDPQGNPIPVPATLANRQLRMQDVRGDLVFTEQGAGGTLAGQIEDLPYDVTFDIRGIDSNAPFTCRLRSNKFELTEHPDIAIFAPGAVKEQLAQYSNPTGTVDVDATIARETAGGPVTVKGVFNLSNGTAAFYRFPYRFYNISATAQFDDNRLLLSSITGEAPGGVKLTATADIGPLNDDAGVDVRVTVTGLPIDQTLSLAMKKRSKFIDELFNAPAYRRLLSEGLVITPAQAREAAARRTALAGIANPSPQEREELAAVAATLAKPVFEPGGRCSVKVGVQRKVGPEAIWNEQIRTHFDEVSFLAEAFPYPLNARDVTISKIDDDATVSGGEYAGLHGGGARIVAKANFEKFDDPAVPFAPEVEVEATGVPIDDLLLFALPTAPELSPDGRPLRELISRLHLEGRADAHAQVLKLADGSPGYRAQINIDEVSASPHADGAPARFSLRDVSGGIDVSDAGLDIDLHATVGPAGEARGAAASLQANVEFGRAHRPGSPADAAASGPLSLIARAAGVEATTPIEDLVAVFSPEAAESLAQIRAERNPTGRADLECVLSRQRGEPLRVAAGVSNLRSVAFTASGQRIGVESTAGTLRYVQGGGLASALIEFEELAGSISTDGAGAGSLTANGAINAEGKPAGRETPLALSLRDARWECPLVRSAMTAAGPASIADFLKATQSTGDFDITLALVPRVPEASAPAGPWSVSGTLVPRSWNGTLDGTPVALNFAPGGRIEFGDPGGSIRDLAVAASAWNGRVQGGWLRSSDGGIAAQTTLSMSASTLTPDLRALLPAEIRGLLADLRVRGDGPVATEDTSISLTFAPGGELAAFKTSGRVNASGLALDTGVDVTRCTSVLDFSAQRAGLTQRTEFEVLADATSLAANGVALTDAKVRVNSGPDGEVLIPYCSADAHGGRITVVGSLSAPAPGNSRDFNIRCKGSNIRFASLMADLRASKAASPAAPAAPPPAPPEPDDSRGLLDFGFNLGGTLNEPASRRGRGTALLGGGRVVSLPLVVLLVRMSNLQLPIDERLDYAQADFFMQGPKIEFERCWISSPGVEIYGFGTATWPDLALDMRFRTRARDRIPLISGVMERIRNELVTATVAGTLADPQVQVQSMSGTTTLFKGLMGNEASAEDRRLQQIEAMSRRDPRRSREDTPGEVQAQPR